LERAHRNGVAVEIVPSLRRAIDPWRDLHSYLSLKRVIGRFRPQVVHTHSAKGGLLGRAAASAMQVPAIVHGVHGAPFHPYQGRGARAFFKLCERWAARHCHAYISVADAMTELMVNSGVAPREKFTTIYSGMEVEPLLAAESLRSPVRTELGYRPEHIVIGKIARLFHLKGHEYVIQAARAVIDANPNARFLLIGEGILRPQFERQIALAGLNDYFKLAGLIPPERIPAMISAMDIVVHASLREGLARVLPQALISAKPVVSYDIDGAREVVLPERTGYLLPPQSIVQMSDALIALAADESLRARLGAEGRRLFTDVFRHQRMTEQIRALYQKLLDSSASAAPTG
jgi:glycosyltransferase involved in cell wall biosynthesis